nr:putative DNA binding domain-containing protein [Melioribacteraceae bacterium]
MINEIEQIIQNGESEVVEFKLSFSKSVIETIVAFSNNKGGKILIGVKNSGEIKGVSLTEETIQNWINEIKQNTEPSLLPSSDIVLVDGKTVVVFSISEFPIKPVAYKDRFFIRRQNSTHKLSVNEIVELRLFSLNYSFDSYEVNAKFNSLDKNALYYFEDKVKKSKRYKISNNIKQDLVKLGIIRDNSLTRAAELLFGLHHTNIHIGRFKSEITIIDDLMIRSPLVLAIDEAMDFI